MKRSLTGLMAVAAVALAGCGGAETAEVPRCKPEHTEHCRQTSDHVWIPYPYWVVLQHQQGNSNGPPRFRSSVPDDRVPSVGAGGAAIEHPAAAPHVAAPEVHVEVAPHVAVK